MDNFLNSKNIYNSKWGDYKYSLNNSILTINSIRRALDKFNLEVISKLENNEIIWIFFKVRILNGPFRNISCLQRVNKLEFGKLEDIFIEYWNIKSSEYHVYPIVEIIFTYKIMGESLQNEKTKLVAPKIINKNKSLLQINGLYDTINFGGYNLPPTMDITKWGNCDFFNNYNEARVFKFNSKSMYFVKLYDKHLQADLKINDKTVVSFKDSLLDVTNLGTFIREIGNQRYEFINQKLIRKSKTYNTKFIQPLSGEVYYKNNFITMDLETKTINGKMVVYHISIFDGVNFSNFYLTDYLDSETMVINAVLSLMKRKYNGYKIYLHNFSNFDGIFLLKTITSLTDKINIIKKDDKIINLQVKFGNNYSILFRDSLLMLPLSLRNLCKSFQIEDKSIFPFDFVNEESTKLNYIGKVPGFKYFKDISTKEYREYCKNFNNKE